MKSLVKNSLGNDIVDANKYLDVLGQKLIDTENNKNSPESVPPTSNQDDTLYLESNAPQELVNISDIDFLTTR